MPAPHAWRRLVGAAVLSVLSVATLGTAAAAAVTPPAIAPWMGIYQPTFRGTQSDTWTWHHEATSQCDAKIDGSGHETDELYPVSGPPVAVTGIGTTVTSISSGGVADVSLTLSREGSVTEVDPHPANPEDCPGASGGGDNGTVDAPPGCGFRSGKMSLLVSPTGLGLHVDQLPESFTTSPYPGDDPTAPFAGCPNLGTYLPTLIPVDLGRPIAVTPPVPGYGPTMLQLSGDQIVPAPDVDTNATSQIHLEATLRGVSFAMDIAAKADDVAISRSGVAKVTLSCPRRARSTCHGTLADYLAAGDPPTTLPAPVPAGASRLGKTVAFRIAAGHHQTVRLALPHGSDVSAFADLTLPIVLTQKDRRGHALAVVIALGHPPA